MSIKIDAAKLSGSNTPRPPMGSYLTVMHEFESAKLEDSQSIPIAQLSVFPNQPFRPYTQEKLEELAADIAEHGVISPVFLRPQGAGYQILSGHNRVAAAKLAGLTVIPAVIHDLDDDAAVKVMVNSNLLQRQELLPSEKAFAYKMRLDAMKRQGARTDLTCAQVAHKSDNRRSRDILAEQSGESKDQIRRYIRLTYLIKDLLDRVDAGGIPFVAGVDLSYLNESQQTTLLSVLEAHHIKRLTNRQASELRAAAQEEGTLDAEDIARILGLTGRTAPASMGALKLSVSIPSDQAKRLSSDTELQRRIQSVVDAYLEEVRLSENNEHGAR